MATAVAQPAERPTPLSVAIRRGALAALVCGILFLVGAACVLAGFLRASAIEQAADDGWTMVHGQVINERVGQFATVSDPNNPGRTMPTYQLQPQIEVQYEIAGQELTAWVDVPTDGPLSSQVSYHHNIAQGALARFHRGDAIACYYDPADATSLRLALGDGGRRMVILGFVLAAVASLPGVGLLLASWLLWRAAGGRRKSQAA